MTPKVLLNCFPPTNLYMPAIGCEVLKSYITKENKIDVEIVYWNHLFQELYQDPETKNNLFQPQDDLHQTLPFLSVLAEEFNDIRVKERIVFKMQVATPSFKTINGKYYEEKYERQIKRILSITKSKLLSLLTDDVLIFGISAKFDAWIPGIIVAKELKKIRPDIKCIIGGIEENEAAKALFDSFEVFDFAIWGEGENPFSLLINHLMKKDRNLSKIPRLLYRDEKTGEIHENKDIEENVLSYYNLQQYTPLEFNDYFKYTDNLDKKNIDLPIEISRGCRWNNCNFCALNWGYKYRTQKFSEVIEQIRKYYRNYKVFRFFFVDNDIVGKDLIQFENFLDGLINLSAEIGVDFNFHADLLHLNFNKRLIKKLSLAGFKSIQIGYEGVCDSMLKKLNKSTTFAENLLFLKFAQKYDIEVSISGIIIGIPGEIEEDIFESTNNLHFLRFLLGEKQLKHRFAELVLFYNTNFWRMLKKSEREKFNKHPLNDYLPEKFFQNEYTIYSLLGQYRTPPLMDKWQSFKAISDHYEKSVYKYYLIENENVINYLEYKDNVKVNSLIFDQPEYWDVLKKANDKIISFEKLYKDLKEKYIHLTESKLNKIINDLNESYLLYSSANRKKNISIIDTDNL